MVALETLEQAQSVELLITRVVFGAGKLNGVALARMMKYKRPEVRVTFTAIPEVEEHAEGLGEFMALPVRVSEIVQMVERILRSQAENSH